MKKNFTLFAGVSLAVLALASCSKKDEFVGSWQAVNPTDISAQLPSSANGSSVVSITFGPDTGQGGDVVFSSLIDVTQSLDATPDVVSPYEVSIAATATVNGKWMYEGHDYDELLVSFDMNSLNVDVDNDGVTFRQNVLTDAQEPVNDSIAAATAAIWKREITQAMRKEIMRYTRLDDVKVKDGTTLRMEIENPNQDLIFRKAL